MDNKSILLAARWTALAPYGAPEIWLIRVTYGAAEPVSSKKGGPDCVPRKHSRRPLESEERVNYTFSHTEMMRALTVWFPFDQCSTQHHIEKVKK